MLRKLSAAGGREKDARKYVIYMAE